MLERQRLILHPLRESLQVCIKFIETSLKNNCPVDTGRKLNVDKTFRNCPERLLNVLNTFNLRPVSAGWSFCDHFSETKISQTIGNFQILISISLMNKNF